MLYRGEIPRGEIPGLLDVTERQSRRITSVLLEQNILLSKSPRAPLKLAFPMKFVSQWMPGLFPEG